MATASARATRPVREGSALTPIQDMMLRSAVRGAVAGRYRITLAALIKAVSDRSEKIATCISRTDIGLAVRVCGFVRDHDAVDVCYVWRGTPRDQAFARWKAARA